MTNSPLSALIILLLDHCFAHVAGFYSFMASEPVQEQFRMENQVLKRLKHPANIKELQPDLLLSVPASGENFRKNIEGSIRK